MVSLKVAPAMSTVATSAPPAPYTRILPDVPSEGGPEKVIRSGGSGHTFLPLGGGKAMAPPASGPSPLPASSDAALASLALPSPDPLDPPPIAPSGLVAPGLGSPSSSAEPWPPPSSPPKSIPSAPSDADIPGSTSVMEAAFCPQANVMTSDTASGRIQSWNEDAVSGGPSRVMSGP